MIVEIFHNRIQCRRCGGVIESLHVNDFRWCPCRAVAVDGGHEYLRWLGNREDIVDLSETREIPDEQWEAQMDADLNAEVAAIIGEVACDSEPRPDFPRFRAALADLLADRQRHPPRTSE